MVHTVVKVTVAGFPKLRKSNLSFSLRLADTNHVTRPSDVAVRAGNETFDVPLVTNALHAVPGAVETVMSPPN